MVNSFGGWRRSRGGKAEEGEGEGEGGGRREEEKIDKDDREEAISRLAPESFDAGHPV